MKFSISILLILASIILTAQEKVEKLQYAKTEIIVPEKCSAKSEFEILGCDGFSAQWLFLNEEMVKQKVDEQLMKQIGQQLEYKTKKPIHFLSQNQKFTGTKYKMKNGNVRIIAFGKVDEIPLVLNLGFNKDPEKNINLTEFEKKFIIFE